MRAYGKIETTFWQNPKVKKLSDGGRSLLLYMLTCPHGNSVGCFVLPDGYICADLEWPSERVSEHVRELVSKGFIERDENTSLTRVLGWWGHNTIENGNVAKAALKALRLLPRGRIFYNAVQELKQLGNKFVNELANAFEDVFRNPEPEPEPEPEPDISVPNGTGAVAPCLPAAIEVLEPVHENSLMSLSVSDYRSALFGPGREYLCAQGIPDSTARGALGRMLKHAGDDARAVFDLLAQAEADRRLDPVAWVMGCLTPKRRGTAVLDAIDRIPGGHNGH